MFKLSIGNGRPFLRGSFKSVLTLGILMLGSTAQAGALRDLAVANNALYRELKDLGTARMSDKVAAQSKHLNPPLRALGREHNETYLSWKKAIKANGTWTKEMIAKILGRDPATGKNLDGSNVESAATSAATPAIAPKGRVAETGTGDQGGSDGAKEAKFGGKRQEHKPVTDDSGIIQER